MSARILMTGSRSWTNVQFATDAINGAIMLLGSHAKEAVLVHGAAQGADVLCANVATGLGMATEAHPAAWASTRLSALRPTRGCGPARRPATEGTQR